VDGLEVCSGLSKVKDAWIGIGYVTTPLRRGDYLFSRIWDIRWYFGSLGLGLVQISSMRVNDVRNVLV
jgi:hypothetical protein